MDVDASNSRQRLLTLLKTRGPRSAAWLAERLGLTATAVRQHLQILSERGEVGFQEQRGGVGRPARHWHLTPASGGRFPDGHADLALEMVAAVRAAFGEQGMERLVAERTASQLERYRERLPPRSAPLSRRVAALARVRREEGYLAEWSRSRDGSCLLVEHHCPVRAAAQVCQGLCVGEQDLFRRLLGRGVRVERCEHLLAGDRRCAYRIRSREADRHPG